MDANSNPAPQVVQPGLELVQDQREKMDQYVNSYGPELASHAEPTSQSPLHQRRNPFGLSPLSFGLLVGAITAIIMGAALGGGIGGALASCQNQKSELQSSAVTTSSRPIASALTEGFSSIATRAPSLTSSGTAASATGTVVNYTPTPIRDIETLALDCPAIDGTTVMNNFNQNFVYTCGVDLGTLPNAAGGNITDLAAIIAYTIEDCIDACSAINFQTFIQGNAEGPTCSSVSWFASARSVVSVGNGNCWLKNGTLASGQTGNEAAGAVSAQAV